MKNGTTFHHNGTMLYALLFVVSRTEPATVLAPQVLELPSLHCKQKNNSRQKSQCLPYTVLNCMHHNILPLHNILNTTEPSPIYATGTTTQFPSALGMPLNLTQTMLLGNSQGNLS